MNAFGVAIATALGETTKLMLADKAEIARLTAALHKAKAHPDYQYIVVPPGDFLGAGPIELAGGKAAGWEPNPEAEVCPGDECWRRKLNVETARQGAPDQKPSARE